MCLRALAISAGGMKLSWPVIWKASAAVAGYSCLNSVGSRSSAILARRHTMRSMRQPVGFGIGALLLVEREAVRHRPDVLLLPEPRNEDRLKVARAGLGVAPQLVEVVADAVGRRLQDDLAARLIRHRLQHAGDVAGAMRPEGHLGAVEQLDGRERPTPLVPAVPTLYPLSSLSKDSSLAFSKRVDGFSEARHVGVVALHHAEQVLRSPASSCVRMNTRQPRECVTR